MAQTTAQKLGIASGTETLVLGQSVAVAHDLFGVLPEGASVSEGVPSAQIVVLFADDVSAVTDSARAACDRVAAGGRLWIAYRKGATRRGSGWTDGAQPLHRDTLQAALAGLGLDGVTLVSLDDTWSAMRVKAV